MPKRQPAKYAQSSPKGRRAASKQSVTSLPKADDENTYLFKDGLYYPHIDVQDEAWLKSALLYWDTLRTIVPEHYSGHYRSETARELVAAKVLCPERVAQGMNELDDTAEECVNFLDSPENLCFLQDSTNRASTPMPRNLCPEQVIHSDKISFEVINELRYRGIRISSEGGWYRVPGWFARYYLTILASRLARLRGYALVTDDRAVEPLADRSMRGELTDPSPTNVAEGLLASLVLRTVNVDANTPVLDLLRFKEHHRDDLGRLKTALRGLVGPIKGNPSIALLRKHLETIYCDQVSPAINDLRARLRDNRIACGFNNLKASSLLSTSPTALGIALTTAGLGPFALLGGIGVSLVLSVANYRLQHRELLRSSPYSYVLLAGKKVGS